MDNAPLACDVLLALRVVKRGREYWARWGHVERAEIGRAQRKCVSGAGRKER